MDSMNLDIIIPVLNEEEILRQESVYYNRLSDSANLIFVDGGSSDQTTTVAGEYGRVLQSKPGRGAQKNFAAKDSSAEAFLFLHVDTFIDPDALNEIKDSLTRGAVGGCLTMAIDDKRPVFRFYEWLVNMRARKFGIIDADLGMFVRKSVFDQLQGFDHVRMMEDILFSKRLRKAGKIDALAASIHVSSRKWDKDGFIPTLGQYTNAYLQSWLGLLK